MRKKVFSLILILACLGMLALAAFSQDDPEVSQGNGSEYMRSRILIGHTEIFGTLQRPQVMFNHGIHFEKYSKEGCEKCHERSAEGEFAFDFPFKITSFEKESVMDSFHEHCIGCHTRLFLEKEKSGPVKCGSCHKKEYQTARTETPSFDFDFAYHESHVKKLEEKTGKPDCSPCHHSYDPEEEDESLRLAYREGQEESCYYCHDTGKKRGPELSVITSITSEKNLTIRKASHVRCIHCHLDFQVKGEKGGPVTCAECHTGKYRTQEELADIPRPERDQPKEPFLFIEDAEMKGVPFPHVEHQKKATTCKTCHHERLRACKKCHGITASPEGGGIQIAGAYHDLFSESGCIGCHALKKSEKDCSGCHHHLLDMDIRARGPKKDFCGVCHSGKKNGASSVPLISVRELTVRDVPEEVKIEVLEKEYGPAVFPHRAVVKRLVEISNESRMANYFHRGIATLCKGCHHESDPEAEVKKNNPPHCRSCHSVTFDQQNMNKPRLIAAYHRQCIGCHEGMGITKTKECRDCHEEKEGRAAESILMEEKDAKE
jgi:hypothetical protein